MKPVLINGELIGLKFNVPEIVSIKTNSVHLELLNDEWIDSPCLDFSNIFMYGFPGAFYIGAFLCL